MAIKQIVPILITLVGDGSSTTFTYSLQNMYQGGVGGSIPYGSGIAVPPSSVVVNNPPVAITSSTVDANGNITITFTSAPANGVQYSLEVDLYFTSGGATSSSPTQSENVIITGGSVTVTGTIAANITQIGGAALALGQTTMSASIPVTIASNQASFPVTVSGTVAVTQSGSWTVAATQSGTWTVQQGGAPWSDNITQWAGSALGAPSNYGTSPGAVAVPGVNAFVTNTVSVSQSGTWTNRIVGNTGATLDATLAAGTAPTNGIANLVQYNTTPPAPTNAQTVSTQSDQAGNLLSFPGVQVKTGSVWNSGTTGGTFQYPTGTTTVGQPLGSGSVIVQLDQSSGTFSAGAVTFQGTYDGTNWITIPVAQLLNPTTFAQLTNPYTFVTSTNTAFLVVMQGFQQIRLNLSTAITGTGTVTPNWTVLPYIISTPSATSSSVNVASWGGTAVTAATAYGTAPSGNVGAVNAYITNTPAVTGSGEFNVNVNQVNGAALSGTNPLFTNLSDGTNVLTANAITTWGTAATGKVLGVNAELFVGNNAVSATNPVPVSATAAANTATNPIFLRITDGTTAITAAVSAYGTAPTGTEVMGVNAFVTNTVTVSGTVTANQGGAPWSQNLTQVAGVALGATAVTNFGTAPAATAVPGVNASLFTGTTGVAAATFGTTNTGNGILTNASLFIGTTVAVAASAGVQKVGISGATGVTLDAAQATAAPANAISVSGTFNNNTGTTGALTAGNASAIQLDNHGLVLVDVASANGAAMSASNGLLSSIVQGGNTAAVKAASTAAVAADQALVVAISPNNALSFGQAGTSNATGAAWTSGTTLNTALAVLSGTFTYDSVVITFNQTTTITGGVATFEVSNDNTNWVGISGINPVGGSPQFTYTFQANTYISFVFNTSGWQYFRVRLSTVITGSGTVTVGYAAQSTSNAPITVKEAKDTGRTFFVWFVDAITSITAEALLSIAVNKGGTLQAASTSYTVDTGKTMRLQSLTASIQGTNSTVQYVKLRVRTGATVTTASPVIAGLLVSSSGSTNNAGYGEFTIPDGLEIAAGQQIGISMVSGTTNGAVTFTLVGYEY
jgi:hypothetical protein